jgi:hypothetical protein
MSLLGQGLDRLKALIEVTRLEQRFPQKEPPVPVFLSSQPGTPEEMPELGNRHRRDAFLEGLLGLLQQTGLGSHQGGAS